MAIALVLGLQAGAMILPTKLGLGGAIVQAQTLDISGVTLTLDDLPPGYQENPDFFTASNSQENGFRFDLDRGSSSHMILGRVSVIDGLARRYQELTPTQWQQIQVYLQNQLETEFATSIGETLASEFNASVQVLESEFLTMPTDLGHVSSGRRFDLELQEAHPYVDLVMFVRGGVVAMVMIVSFEGDANAVSAVELAQLLDQRVPGYLQEQPIQLQLSDAVIRASDLPSNFQTASPEEIAAMKRRIDFGLKPSNRLGIDLLTFTSFFELQRVEGVEAQIIAGGTFFMSDELAVLGYRFNEEILLTLTEGFTNKLPVILPGLEVEADAERVSRNLTGVGDVAIATKQQFDFAGTSMDVELILFQRDQVIAFIILAHSVGGVPVVLPDDLARLLDQRIQEILID
ncbi:MAG: hypothetical protein AAGG51_09095 [Cyanobacteria bacterium P01_G01_bin.54]